MDTAKRLALFANTLDQRGLTKLADNVDSVLTSVTKTAQYVGIQGYWVRNQRCWANCYRQKRASSPTKEAQKIWFECQEEYQKSLGAANATWDKYASDNGTFVKLASHQQQEQYFLSKLSEANDPSFAFEIINDVFVKATESYVDASSKMLRIAEAFEESDILLANEAGSISGGLLKEAQAVSNLKGLWNQFSNKLRGRTNPQNFNQKNMISLVKQLDNTLQGYVQQKQQISQMLSAVKDPKAGPIAQQMKALMQGSLTRDKIKQLNSLAGEFDKISGSELTPGQNPEQNPGLLNQEYQSAPEAPASPAPEAAPPAPATPTAPTPFKYTNPAFNAANDAAEGPATPAPAASATPPAPAAAPARGLNSPFFTQSPRNNQIPEPGIPAKPVRPRRKPMAPTAPVPV